MDLRDIWYGVQYFVELRGGGRRLNLDMFNKLLQMADDEELLTLLRMVFNPSTEVEANQEQLDLLDKFKVSTTLGGASVSVPLGYVRFVSCRVGSVKVDMISEEEYTERKACSLTAPSTTYPVIYLQNGYIKSDPTPSALGTDHTFVYYGGNVQNFRPLLVMKQEYDIPVYNSSSSVELVWPEHIYPNIIWRILKYLNISVGDPNAIAETLKKTTDAP